MADFSKMAQNALDILNPDKSAGKTLMVLNALGIGFAAAANTYAAATDKNTSAEDKKFLVPAGGVTGLANLGIYFGMTSKLVKGLENVGHKVYDIMINNTKEVADAKKNHTSISPIKENLSLTKVVNAYIDKKLLKAKKTETPEFVRNMEKNLRMDGKPTAVANALYQKDLIKGMGVVGAFIGAVVGCAIITPILRDVSAYLVQKLRESKDPTLKDKPYRPYFDISHIRAGKYPYGMPHKPDNRPLSMTSYLNFTHGRTRV